MLAGVSTIAASLAPAAVGVPMGLRNGRFTTMILFLAGDLLPAGAATAEPIPAGR